jgi:tetratricopeptide (TPR) repeat protein
MIEQNNIWKKASQNNLVEESNVSAIADAVNLYPYCSAVQLLYLCTRAQQFPDQKKNCLPKAKLYSGNLYIMHKNLQVLKIEKTIQQSDDIILPPFVDNYFAYQKIETTTAEVDSFVEQQIQKKENKPEEKVADDEASLMITMSFDEWLQYFKTKKQKEAKENESKQAMRAIWQKEKLSEAIGEENDVIPENVFKMAIDSMSLPEGTASESLAEIMLKQGKTDKAIEMYRKLSLLNPEKSSYFASKTKNITKNI